MHFVGCNPTKQIIGLYTIKYRENYRNIYDHQNRLTLRSSMDEKIRITKDIIMFKENLQGINIKNLTIQQQQTIELAIQYYQDAQYYLEKKDFFTAFGCINYAHGLLDALIKF